MLRMDIHDFLSRVSTLMLTRDIDVAILSVDSVRPSVRITRWYCMIRLTISDIVIVFFTIR